MKMLLFYLMLVLPIASPFASGSTLGVTSITSSLHKDGNTPSLPFNTPTGAATRTARYMATSTAAATPESKSSLHRFWQRLQRNKPSPPTGPPEGETKASLLSKLFFLYVNPLVNLAQDRRLDVDDAYTVSPRSSMERSVPSLGRIYKYVRKQAIKDSAIKDKPVSEAWLLTRALLLQQRRMLLLTGILRFLNTAIQAVPSMLVAHILRLIEAGDTHAPAKALRAAVGLMLLLTIKMMTENQYFHYVVKCATQVRGSLSGVIFDKSLRLPGGGSGVTYTDKQPGVY
jgi:hypothetical protein